MRRLARPLLYSGILVAVVGLSKVHAEAHGYSYHQSDRLAWSLAYAGLLGLAAYGVGLPELARSRRAAVLSAVVAGFAAAMGISAAQLVLNNILLPRLVVFGAAIVLVPWFAFCARLADDGRVRAEGRERVLVVGQPDEVSSLAAELERAPERNAHLVGVVSIEDARPEGSGPSLLEMATAKAVTVIALSRAAQVDERVVAQAALLHSRGVRIRTLSLFYEEWLGKLPISELERVSLMFDIGELHRARYVRVKRLVDIALALVGFPVLAVMTPIVVVGDVFANRGPLLYRQSRVGKNGRVFTILKYRTMRDDPTAGTGWTTDRDHRITRFGRLLRSSHLDELPQMWNVLRGDLSIVGPRPEQPHYVAELVDKIPFYDVRHLVRPGLTGWRQVKYGYAGSDAEALEGLQYDFYYLRRQSLTLDLRIIGRTIRSVVGGAGR